VEGTYGSLANCALAELVEVNEELLNSDAILSDSRLDALLNVVLVAKDGGLPLVIALMTMSSGADVLNVIAD
jgi:hypothetical protein